MKTNDLNTIINATMLNENMYKKFGVKINFDKYTREELENYRNLLRTKVNQLESNANFNELLSNESYQKNKFVMGVLNQKIKEMLGEGKKVDKFVKNVEKSEEKSGKSKKKATDIAWATANKKGMLDNKNKKVKEGSKPDFLDVDKDGDKKEPMKKAIKDKTMNKKVKETMKIGDTKTSSTGGKITKTKTGVTHKAGNAYSGKTAEKEEKSKKIKENRKVTESINRAILQFLREDEEGKAKSITAGGDMVNDFTSWMTRVGQYQTKSMIELADTIRANFGQAAADQFKNTIQPALDEALSALTQSRETISHAVAVLAGEESGVDQMGAEEPGMDEFGADQGFDAEEIPPSDDGMNGGDEFAAADAAAGGAETAGRMRRESREVFARKLDEAHSIISRLSK